jgi:PAS domain S-box-containing protein
MSLYSFLSGILIGLLLLSAALSLFFALRRVERRINFAYFGFAVFIGAAMVHGVFLMYARDLPVMLLHEKLLNSFLLLGGISFLYLVESLTEYHARIVFYTVIATMVGAIAMNWVLPYGLTWGTVHGITTHEMFWGETVFGLDGETGPGNIFVMILLLALLAYTGRAVAYQLRHGQREYARALILATAIGLLGVLLDVVLTEFETIAIGVIDDIGVFAFILLVGHRNFAKLLRSNDLLRESEERFSMLTDAAFEGIGFSEKGIILDVNRQLAEMLGYTVDEMIGRKVLDFVAPVSHSLVKKQTLSSEEPVYEHYALHREGRHFPFEVRVKNMTRNDANIRVTAIRDISERKRAEEENALLAQTLKSVRDCISITDSSDRIIFVNDAFLATYGYDEDEVIGQHVELLRSPTVAPEKTQGIFPSTREGGWHGEVLNRRKNGSEFPVELWTSVVRDQAGSPIAYVGVARDISDRRFAEQAIIAEKERAERSDRLKDAFIANISHEVRTPLNIILGYTGLIGELMKERADEEEQGYYESVQRGAERLQRTVDMILSISRLQVGDINLDVKELDLSRILGNIVEDYHTMAAEKSLTLTLDVQAEDATVVADEYCTVQTVQNLLDNAIKYTQAGGVTLGLLRTPDGTVCIEVRDTGIGISDDYLPLLFEPYTQEESGYSRSFEGIGLGMSLVKKYTELIGARVRIQSAKNHGTTITIAFPTKTSSTLVSASSGASTLSDVGETEGAGADIPTVLIVEDERLTIEYMSTLLKNHVHLHFAESASEAWEILLGESIDLVFMDISLSGEKSGLDITREIRAHERLASLPVVAVTAHGFAHDRNRCLDAGCNAYLLKPVGQDDLLDTIRTLLPADKISGLAPNR